ncbi:hypothetical protein AAVH_13600 [Aphelenchoides avenae]|nr:hypothetical protein AAVH_13600 [Aphelenchus avenae]
MAKACVLLVALLCMAVVRCTAERCAAGDVLNKPGDHCYQTGASSKWDFWKGVLASIPSADYLDIRALARNHFKFVAHADDSDNFWLGGRAVGGKWMWHSFDDAGNDVWSPMKYTNWENRMLA